MSKRQSKGVTERRGVAAARTRRQKAGEPGRAVVTLPPSRRPRMVGPRVAAKEALESAFDKMGGVANLVAWGRLNPTEFYRIWARLLPKDVSLSADASLEELLKKLAAGGEAEPVEGEFSLVNENG